MSRTLAATTDIDETSKLEKAVEFPEALLPDLPVDPEERTMTPEVAAREAREFFGVGPGPI